MYVLAEAKATIGDHALDRMSKALSEFRNIALAAAAVLTTFGALSYFQLQSQVFKTVTAKLDDWLALDKPGSLARTSLETARARTELDAFVVKLERADLTGHDDPLQLSEADKGRLVSYLMDSSTSLSDFRDGVVVLGSLCKTPGGPLLPEAA